MNLDDTVVVLLHQALLHQLGENRCSFSVVLTFLLEVEELLLELGILLQRFSRRLLPQRLLLFVLFDLGLGSPPFEADLQQVGADALLCYSVEKESD